MIHIYHGNGKGKTTAAIGLAVRAAGAGLRVVVLQMLKGRESGEVPILRGIPGVTVLRGKNSGKFSFQMDEKERAAARRAHTENLAAALSLAEKGECDLLVLDEALDALDLNLLDEADIRQFLSMKYPPELVFTGRNPPDYLLEAADYTTEMRSVRHPFEQGVAARKGIEY